MEAVEGIEDAESAARVAATVATDRTINLLLMALEDPNAEMPVEDSKDGRYGVSENADGSYSMRPPSRN